MPGQESHESWLLHVESLEGGWQTLWEWLSLETVWGPGSSLFCVAFIVGVGQEESLPLSNASFWVLNIPLRGRKGEDVWVFATLTAV